MKKENKFELCKKCEFCIFQKVKSFSAMRNKDIILERVYCNMTREWNHQNEPFDILSCTYFRKKGE